MHCGRQSNGEPSSVPVPAATDSLSMGRCARLPTAWRGSGTIARWQPPACVAGTLTGLVVGMCRVQPSSRNMSHAPMPLHV